MRLAPLNANSTLLRRASALFLLGALCLALAVTAPAKVGAAPTSPFLKAIRVNPLTEDGLGPLLVKFKTLQCGLYGKGEKKFHAFANAGSPQYRLTLFIDSWQGFGRSYNLYYSSDDPLVRLFAPGSDTYSNEYTQPGPAWAGKISFKSRGNKVALAFIPAIDGSASKQVSMIGQAECNWRTPRS